MERDRADDAFARRTALRSGRLEALASGFVATLALGLSAYTVYVQRQQLKVQAWPRLSVESTTVPGSSPDELHVTFFLKNRGVAPAEVKSVHVRFGSEELRDWPGWLTRVGRRSGLEGKLSASKASEPVGQILGVGEEYVLLATDSSQTAAAIARASDQTSLSFCYCSVLDDCWVLDVPVQRKNQTTRPIADCPIDEKPFLGWPEGASEEWAASILDAGPPIEAGANQRDDAH